MQTIGIIRGRVTGPTSVELEEPVPLTARDVEIWVKVATEPVRGGDGDVFQFLRGLPGGTRTKDEIDTAID